MNINRFNNEVSKYIKEKQNWNEKKYEYTNIVLFQHQ